MSPQPLLEWSRVLSEFVEFLGALVAVGAVGYRFAVLPAGRPHGAPVAGEEHRALVSGLRVAAVIGLVGALIGIWHLAEALPGAAARQHVSVGELIRATPTVMIWVVGSVLAAAGFAAAAMAVPFGWWLAGLGVVAGTLRGLASGQIERLAKPLHVFAAGLWVGTLFVLVVAGLLPILRARMPADRRGRLVASLVHAFSPLALVSAGLLGALGLYLAWRELGGFAALATPYGKALIVKLVLVAGVLGLGGWNWRKIKPRLGTESAARALLGTASAELLVALLVVVATAVLVSLPSPH